MKKLEEISQDVAFYLAQPYTRIVQKMDDESGVYFYGRILELDGCQSSGDTVEELYANLDEALEGYIEAKLMMDSQIPLPVKEDDFSGKFVVRIPKSLHQRLTVEAEKEGISLNQYAMYKLAK